MPKGSLMDAVVDAVAEHIVGLTKDETVVHLFSRKFATPVLTRLVDQERIGVPGAGGVTRFFKMKYHTRPYSELTMGSLPRFIALRRLVVGAVSD